MLSETGFYIVYGIGILWFTAAGIYAYKAAIKDFIQLYRDREKKV